MQWCVVYILPAVWWLGEWATWWLAVPSAEQTMIGCKSVGTQDFGIFWINITPKLASMLCLCVCVGGGGRGKGGRGGKDGLWNPKFGKKPLSVPTVWQPIVTACSRKFVRLQKAYVIAIVYWKWTPDLFRKPQINHLKRYFWGYYNNYSS